jgi:uncharacterized membrane protein YiaA
MTQTQTTSMQPTAAFVGASWVAFFIGLVAFLLGLRYSEVGQRGYFLTLLLYGLFSAVSLQKSVRDRSEGIPVTTIYFWLCWISLVVSVGLMAQALGYAPLTPSQKGLQAVAFSLSMFAAVAVQKNVRDRAATGLPFGRPISLDQHFAGRAPRSRELFEAVRDMIESIGPASMGVTKNEVAFRRRLVFAWTWLPGPYVHDDIPPLVLTVALDRRDNSPRWGRVWEAQPGRFSHHLELRSVGEVDAEVLAWLREAWERAE